MPMRCSSGVSDTSTVFEASTHCTAGRSFFQLLLSCAVMGRMSTLLKPNDSCSATARPLTNRCLDATREQGRSTVNIQQRIAPEIVSVHIPVRTDRRRGMGGGDPGPNLGGGQLSQPLTAPGHPDIGGVHFCRAQPPRCASLSTRPTARSGRGGPVAASSVPSGGETCRPEMQVSPGGKPFTTQILTSVTWNYFSAFGDKDRASAGRTGFGPTKHQSPQSILYSRNRIKSGSRLA